MSNKQAGPTALPQHVAVADYRDNAYRSEHVAEALADARRTGWRFDAEDDMAPSPPPDRIKPPTATERTLMYSLHIDFDGRAYRFGGYHYDRLSDAVNYARMAAGRD